VADYRDETETLRARVTELEGKLAVAEEEAARLRGERASATAAASQARDPLVGEPLHFVTEIDVDHELDEAGYEAIASLLRERRNASASQVGRSLHAPGFSLSTAGGRTHMRLETDLRSVRGAIIAVPGLAGLFVGLPATGVVLDLATHGVVSPWHLAWAIPAVLAGSVLGMRALVARNARTGRTAHEGIVHALREIAEKHRAKSEQGARIRVEAVQEDEALEDEPTSQAAERRG
jgi:hypothetical protein